MILLSSRLTVSHLSITKFVIEPRPYSQFPFICNYSFVSKKEKAKKFELFEKNKKIKKVKDKRFYRSKNC